jgi:hypothetical protein
VTHDAEALATFLAEHQGKTLPASHLTGIAGHAHVLIPVEALQERLLGASLPIPLEDGATLHVQRLPGGALVTFELAF